MKNGTNAEAEHTAVLQWRQHVEEEVQCAFFAITDELLSTRPEVKVESAWDVVALEAEPKGKDTAILLGSGGIMAEAVRCILSAVARRHGMDHCHYRVQDDHLRVSCRRPTVANPAWPKEEIDQMVVRLCAAMFSEPVRIEWVPDNHCRDISHIEVRLSASEPKRTTDAQLKDALSCVVAAVGAANGRRIYVERLDRCVA